eukprot:COSAG06_NODE_753_length_12547_cov_928.116244_6_plen_110_part_00
MAHAQRGTSGRRGRGHIDVSGAEPVAGAASGGQGETDRQRAIRAGSRRRARARAADRHGGATDKLDGGRTEKASGLRRHGALRTQRSGWTWLPGDALGARVLTTDFAPS